MKKVTGVGGIFFKSKYPDQLKEWYAKNLGFQTDAYGTMFEWRKSDDPDQKGLTVWNPFPDDTTYFAPSKKEFMVNYIVENLEELVLQLKQDGVTILDEIAVSDYGKFVHILDPEGNSIELWEPPVNPAANE
ncbi:lactoylglutathione lyase [Chitinophaga niastensis]|uniref:Lactoylglutathione lyase n=1 Tax=Chitinophaga niastensis TaxID=536980 RepID=A0A2P8HD75_CHINA|nr:VOC family protein [Chitinophaga niastensis]PSL44185.1 lactoylglutathione lyase [Chitinophaga niastensis]